jgi:hypothetical protein
MFCGCRLQDAGACSGGFDFLREFRDVAKEGLGRGCVNGNVPPAGVEGPVGYRAGKLVGLFQVEVEECVRREIAVRLSASHR